jgi:hypothetical protein
MRQVAVVVFAGLLAVSPALAQSSGKAKSTKTSTQSTSARLEQMQKAIEAQQQQLNQLRQELQSKDQSIQQLQQQVSQAQGAAAQAEQKADAASAAAANPQQQQDLNAVKSDVADLKQNLTNTTLALQETQKNVTGLESPLAIHYKGITITPGGFLAAETVWRQRATGGDINTPFNSIPFPGSAQANTSEFYGSGRQSRISLLGEGHVKAAKVSGYYEADFLSAGVTSNNNESNSYTLRQRQVWGQAALHGWSFTGGQMWSLVTETKKGVDNRTEALPMTIDPQYTAGFSWARQYGFRVAKNFGDKIWLAGAVENAQINSVGGGGFNNNFVVGSLGNGGGLYNTTATYSSNYSPDVVAKLAFEPGFGHYEVYGIGRFFRDRIYPCETASATNPCSINGSLTPTATGANNQNHTGGGIGANARITLAKHFDIGAHFLGGNGIGRYGSSGLPDVTVRPDGTLVPLREVQGLGTLEFHSKRWDVYFNYGLDYAQRTVYTDPVSDALMGYGRPSSVTAKCAEPLPGTANSIGFNPGSSCKGDTRSLSEGVAGFWYRIYNGPYGRIQFGGQYSYFLRSTWSGSTGAEPKATENMFLTSFRYYLP